MTELYEPGPQAVARVVRDRLAARVAPWLVILEDAWGFVALDPKVPLALPSFTVDDRARLEPDTWPTVKVLPGRLASHLPQDRDAEGYDGGMAYTATYRLALWTWARGQDWEATVTARARLMLAVRYALLEQEHLDDARRLVARSLIEDYYDVAGKAGRASGPGVTTIDVRATEGVSRPPLGTADTIAIVIERLPSGS